MCVIRISENIPIRISTIVQNLFDLNNVEVGSLRKRDKASGKIRSINPSKLKRIASLNSNVFPSDTVARIKAIIAEKNPKTSMRLYLSLLIL